MPVHGSKDALRQADNLLFLRRTDRSRQVVVADVMFGAEKATLALQNVLL